MSDDRGAARTGIAEATLRAARRMGLSRLFLQVIAQEMPDHALVGLKLEDSPDGVVARAVHVCDPGCDLTAHGCLTALKVQALLGHQRHSPYAVAHLRGEGDHVRIHLTPLLPAA